MFESRLQSSNPALTNEDTFRRFYGDGLAGRADVVRQGGPKVEEWYLAFALIVSLAWVYFEAVKLVARLAILFGNRD